MSSPATATPTTLNVPLSLYIHIPWCVRKCPYCDFNSHEQKDTLPEQAYISAMLEDLDQDLAFIQGRELQSIFIGGGTPSLFSPEAYQRLLTELQHRIRFAPDIEITLEANPGTVEQSHFNGYRESGINRLSIGVQSFDPSQLQKLGRIHDSDDALRAISCAQKAGFSNFNVDLMHGLNNQSQAEAVQDINLAINAGAPHISWYQLTIEPNTEFYKRPPRLPLETDMHRIQNAGSQALSDAGFQRYEVSAYAKAGHQSRHNLNYWQFGDYLAIGAGAHGKITQENGQIIRYQKTRKPEDYLSRSPSRSSKIDTIAADDLPLEFMMNALRLRQGFSAELFEQRTNLSWQVIADTISRLTNTSLLMVDQDKYAPTHRGYDMLDSILAEFLPD
ncbi:Oxygen-independent coproporphyrinogen-III oxidase-like protein [Zhongshania aliphaticivorans]|uniref:Heme chaperone HemW n=1 Tax=Zhongshania aliphaticivorans TaxID=1470434 RepID=A0A5S9Q6T4_9GAMM|nr:radical SAM family heme chaperone HemW [Zhongshania aliphaticivorans]CAA0103317.1 Oxygen-independent coproporphyrinogen-III oxidase-like protein [Zhongshania aliphaticivorans]CAA0113610.1 Oxygen-independent coproporphyrinogen-III oxidase-like protein [Zhongshania aliphaticivorans]